jgi:hypothetical protein
MPTHKTDHLLIIDNSSGMENTSIRALGHEYIAIKFKFIGLDLVL